LKCNSALPAITPPSRERGEENEWGKNQWSGLINGDEAKHET